jgi:hypothetical protein
MNKNTLTSLQRKLAEAEDFLKTGQLAAANLRLQEANARMDREAEKAAQRKRSTPHAKQ